MGSTSRLITDKKFDDVKDLIYPPPKIANAGRANDPGAPLLYLSNNRKTVCSELGLTIGDKFQLLKMTILPNQKLTVLPIGEIDHIYRTKRCRWKSVRYEQEIESLLDVFKKNQLKEDYLRHLFVDAFFSAQFYKRAKKQYEYVVTRAISRILLENSEVDGIQYPSVESFGGVNLAIKPEAFQTKMQILSSEEHYINDYLGYDIYNAHQKNVSRDILENGRVIWDSP